MISLIIFNMAQALIAIMLLFFVFDFRFRGEKRANSGVPLLIGILFPLYTVGYMSVIFTHLESVGVLDLSAFVLTALGTALAVKARIDLKGWYAWPGQFNINTQLVRTGIYAYMRHPLYVGVFVFIMGTLITVVMYSGFIFGIFMVMIAASVLAFVALAAKQEEVRLQNELGEIYVSYQCEVNAVLPLGRKRDVLRFSKREEEF